MITIDTKTGKSFEIMCDFSENDVIKMMPNRRFNAKKRVWVAPCLARNIDFLNKNAPRAIWTPKALEVREKVSASVRVPAPAPIPLAYSFKTQPFEKQLEVVSKFWNRDIGAWFMGTGTGKSKSLIDLAAVKYVDDQINAIVVTCPATVKLPWLKTQWTAHCSVPYECYVHDGDLDKLAAFNLKQVDGLKVVMVSTEAFSVGAWERMVKGLEQFFLCHRVLFAVDEGHDVKNHKSGRTEQVTKLGTLCTQRFLMTGTPIDEGIMDLFAYFEFLNPNILGFGDFYSFRARYAIMGGYEDKQIVSYQNVDELLTLVEPFIFQCSKEEMKDMPDKLYQRRYVKMTPAMNKHYKTLTKELNLAVDARGGLEAIDHDVENVLEKMMLQQFIASGFFSYNRVVGDPDAEEIELERDVHVIEELPPKIKECMKWIDQDVPKGASVIIWSRWTLEAQLIARLLGEKYGEDQVLWLRGGMGAAKKDVMREKFEAREARFFVAHPAAGGVGLTLNAATFTAYLSNTFRYLHRQQSEDRNHRIGQEHNVTYMDFITEGTVDEHVLEAIAQKHNVASWVDKTIREKRNLRNG